MCCINISPCKSSLLDLILYAESAGFTFGIQSPFLPLCLILLLESHLHLWKDLKSTNVVILLDQLCDLSSKLNNRLTITSWCQLCHIWDLDLPFSPRDFPSTTRPVLASVDCPHKFAAGRRKISHRLFDVSFLTRLNGDGKFYCSVCLR